MKDGTDDAVPFAANPPPPNTMTTTSNWQSIAATPSIGFDADQPLTAQQAQQFQAAGYRFCARYLSLSLGQQPGDLSPEEVGVILDAKLALLPVQHVLESGWSPSPVLGVRFGDAASENARSLGIPSEVTLWCDLEGVSMDTPVNDIIGYCNAWFDAVAAQGYSPGLYVGYQCLLSSTQLYHLKFEHYWCAPGVPVVATRGYQVYQLIAPQSMSLFGVQVDQDMIHPDQLGGVPRWLVSGEPTPSGD